jgi:hypothetical protein
MKLIKWFKRRKLLNIYRNCDGQCNPAPFVSCEHWNYNKCQIIVKIDEIDGA